MKKKTFATLLVLFLFTWVGKTFAGQQVEQLKYTWKPININGGGGINFVVTDPVASNIVYAGIDVGGVYRSTDSGENWKPYNYGLIWPGDRLAVAFTIDPRNGFVYLGTGRQGEKGGIFRRTPGDKRWQLLTRKIKFSNSGQRTGRDLIAVHPSNPKIIYSGSYQDGIFKSIDGGGTWVEVGLQAKHLSSIRIDYSNPRIIYASAYTSPPSGRKKKDTKEEATGGIYKSVDDGTTWKKVSNQVRDVYQLVMDPKNPNIIYAAAGSQGIFKTVDGGESWESKNKGLSFLAIMLKKSNFLAIAIDPKDNKTLYATSGYPNGHVYKSVDGAESWKLLTGEKKNIHPGSTWLEEVKWLGGKRYAGFSIAIDAVNTQRLYISGTSAIWKSDDGGITWHLKSKGLEATCMNQILLDPKRPDTFYVGNTDWVFFWSDDGGKTIKRTLKGMGNWDTDESKHIFRKYKAKDGISFAIDTHTDPSTVYIALDSGQGNRGTVFQSTDGGESWSEANKGLPIAGVVGIAIDPTNYNVLYTAIRRKGISKTVDGGKNWQAINNGLPKAENLFKKCRLHPILINPNSPDIVYVLDKGSGVYKTVDGGKNWQIVSDGLPQKGIWGMIHFAGAMVMDPKQPDTLYIGLARHGIYKTLNGGKTWQKISPDFIYHGGAMDIDRQTGDLYVSSVPEAGEEDVADIKNPGIYKSPDGGKTWFALHNDELLNISLRILSLAVDPHHQGRVYLTTMGNGIIVGEPN